MKTELEALREMVDAGEFLRNREARVLLDLIDKQNVTIEQLRGLYRKANESAHKEITELRTLIDKQREALEAIHILAHDVQDNRADWQTVRDVTSRALMK